MHCTQIFGGKTSFTQERVCLGPILIHWTLTHTHIFSSDRIILESKDFLATTHTRTHVFIRPDYIGLTNFFDKRLSAGFIVCDMGKIFPIIF